MAASRRFWLKSALAVVSVVSVISMGGLVLFTAPVLLPGHWWAASNSGSLGRAIWIFLATVIAAEAVWLLTYLAVQETSPAIWVLPLLAAVAVATTYFFTTTRARTR